jgi:Zn-dependent peptidase ImmA (M78 family)
MIDSREDEREANYFAMQLLVPSKLLLADLDGDFSLDPTNDDRVVKLAKKYGVSHTLIILRILEEAKRHTGRF